MSASLEKGVNVLREMLDAPIASYFSSCVRCGLCAEACLFYTETGDPKYTPINKVEPLRRLWEQEYTLTGKLKKMVGLSKAITHEELEAWSELAYDSCTMCSRCSMNCPVGNDIAYIIRKFREGLAASGHAPEGVIGAVQRTINLGSPMGVKLPALQAQIRAIEAETGLTIPIDVQGVDYMALLSSMEIMNFPEYIGALAKIFNKAGVSWTISSKAFEATNSGIQIGVSDLAREIVLRVVDAAEELGVKKVISPECGHAFTAIRWDGPNLIGRPYKFEVVHILELLDQLRSEGRIKLQGKEHAPLTFHDPCQIVRRGGVDAQPRSLLGEVAEDFREMTDHGVWNWCCGGGGGVSANERAEPLQLKAFNRKKSQLEEIGVTTMVSACANCRIVLEEGVEHNNMQIEVVGLTEVVADHLQD